MDLSTFDVTPSANEGAVMQLRHPTTGEPLEEGGEPITITLLGTDSDTFLRVNDAAINRRLKAPNRALVVTAEEQRATQIELLVACTLDWKHVGTKESPDLPYSKANAKLVYSKLKWVRDQVDVFVVDRSNFMKQPSVS